MAKPLAKPTKITEDDTEFEEISESYNVKAKSNKQIDCDDKDKCKVNIPKKEILTGAAAETFASDQDKKGDQKPVTIKQGDAITDLNIYNKKDDEKKADK